MAAEDTTQEQAAPGEKSGETPAAQGPGPLVPSPDEKPAANDDASDEASSDQEPPEAPEPAARELAQERGYFG
jgi:hypothetical protein